MSQSYIENDAFARLLGIRLVESRDDFAICEMQLTDDHLNGLGTPHGAVIFAIADVALAAACNTRNVSIGMQAEVRYFSKPQGGQLLAQASLVSASRKIGHYQVQLRDAKQTLVAQVNATIYRLAEKAES